MIKEVRISKIDDLMPILADQEFREDLGRNRSLNIYRGVPNCEFTMVTSLRRNCKDLERSLEPAILKNFAKYGVSQDATISNSIWKQMILGRHHGLPTRLLDWSQSPLVALHFSVDEDNLDNMDKHDSVIWRMSINELHSLLPEKYQAVLSKYQSRIFSVDMLTEAAKSLEEYDADMGTHSMVVIEPPSIDQRIVNQYSFFTVVPMGVSNVEEFVSNSSVTIIKYIIDKKLRWRIRDMLDQLNMSERTVYPGLDGLSRWIGRHYFVK